MNDEYTPSRFELPPWPNASLRTYLIVVILLATVPIASLMSYQIFGQLDAQRERLQNEMQRSAAQLAHSVNRELVSSIDALNILSYSGEIQQGKISGFEQALLDRPLMRPSWSSVYLASPAGQVLLDTAKSGRKAPIIELEHGKSPASVGPSLSRVSNLRVDQEDGGFLTTVEVPVLIDGTQRYVLGARIKISVWQQLVENAGLSAPGVTVIFDGDYRLIARNHSPGRFVGKSVSAANRESIAGHVPGAGKLEMMEGGSIYAAWDGVPLSSWGVSVGMPAAPIDAANNRAIAVALATAAACLLLGVFLAQIVARRMTRPLRRLAHMDLSQPAERIAVREISLLRDALIAAQAQEEAARDQIRHKGALLQKKADEFETLLASCPIGLAFAQDPLCRVVIHNAAMEAMFSTTSADGVTVLCDGLPLPTDRQPLQRAAAFGETTSGMELEVRIDGAEPVFIIVNAVPLYDDDGHTRGAIGAVIDITGRKAAEARLIAAEQDLREMQRLVDLAQETGHVGFFHYRIDIGQLAWTPGQARLFGIANETIAPVLAEWTWRIDHADWFRMLRHLLNAFRVAKDNETLDYRVHLPNGSICWLSTRLRLIYDRAGRPQQIIGVSIDMTEQKEAERQRAELNLLEKAARVEAETANRAKDEFLAMLGHELRNPLSAIASGVEVLNRVDSTTEVAGNARRIIDRQARHLAHMMDDLLDVARLISGQIVMSRHHLDLAALVRRVMATLEITGEPSNHQLVTNIEEVWIDADATRIEQVVNNLLINAIKYTPPGGTIAVCVGPDGDDARLEVHDNGAGIAPELLPHVFDLFVQGARSLDRRGGGLGVGLTLTRRLVELHGGTVTIRNAEPGTIICVRLPAIEPPAIMPVRLAAPTIRARSIVIIEDNPDVLDALRVILELDGHIVLTAIDGQTGLELVLRRRPDVAIVDIGLPGLTGYEVAKRCRAGGYAGKMVAISGYGQAQDVRQAMAAGFDLHFVKPIDLAALRGAIAAE